MGIELPQFLRDLTADGWTAVAAFLALAISATSAIVRGLRWLVSRRRADVIVRLGPGRQESRGHAVLIFENRGPAIARDVHIVFDVPAGAARPMFVNVDFPIETVNPGLPVQVPTILTVSVPNHFQATVTWHDGRRGEQSNTVTVSRG